MLAVAGVWCGRLRLGLFIGTVNGTVGKACLQCLMLLGLKMQEEGNNERIRVSERLLWWTGQL